MNIILLNDLNIKNIPSEKQFELWINSVIKKIPSKIPKNIREISISIIDEKTSRELNKTYRHKDYPTNVLSFHYDAIPGEPQASLGDLAICAAVVDAEAKTQHKNRQSHWAHLAVHGMLHLLGFDHENEKEANSMEALEIEILNTLNIQNPYE